MSDKNLELELLDKTLERNLKWIDSADSKISPIFAINAAMLTALTALASQVKNWDNCDLALLLAGVIALLPGIGFLAYAAFPRLRSSQSSKGSVVYFSSAITHTEAEYVRRLAQGPTPELVQDLGRQAYRSAEIAHIKYTAVRRALLCLFVFTPVWLVIIGVLIK